MGKFNEGIHAFSGKVGKVAGSKWKGVDVMKAAPKPSKKAATEDQVMQRVFWFLL